jgi:hypothetical protein
LVFLQVRGHKMSEKRASETLDGARENRQKQRVSKESKPIPRRVVEIIETKTGQELGQRRARVVGCKQCGEPVFRGLDADIAALEVCTDVRPLNAAGELAALIAGRATFELTWERGRGRYELRRRDQWQIAGRPPGTGGMDVLAAHHCGLSSGSGRLQSGPAAGMVEQPTEPPF